MIRRAGRTRPCSGQTAEKRLAQADAFATLATMDIEAPEGPVRSAAVSNAVLAAIAAVDTLCCRRLGRYSVDRDHDRALDLLGEAGEAGSRAARHLRVLLGLKNKAQYEETDPSVAEARKAVRAMSAIIDIARTS